MNVCGIDYSSHAVDLVFVDVDDLDPPLWNRCELTEGADAFERAASLKRLPSHLFEDTLAIGIEDPRGQNAGALYRVQGAILANLPSDVLVTPWVPSQWRKAVDLRGSATKHEVAVRAGNRSGVYRSSDGDSRISYAVKERLHWPQDACDAYCIALATRAAITVGEAQIAVGKVEE